MAKDGHGDLSPATDAEVMTLTEIASYLKVSEKTILRMARAGRIPATKVSNQWRFLRPIVDDWLITRMRRLPKRNLVGVIQTERPGTPLLHLISPERILCGIERDSKERLLAKLAMPLAETGIIPDTAAFVEKLVDRENTLSTALGHGVAMPHVRDPETSEVRTPAVVLGICGEGAQFDALDGQPTYVFALIAGNCESSHLQLLARMSLLFRKTGIVARLRQCTQPDAVRDILAEADTDWSAKKGQPSAS